MNVKSVNNFLVRTRPLYLYCVTICVTILIIWFWNLYVFEPLECQERQLIGSIETLERKRLVLPDLKFQIRSLKQKNTHVHNDYTSMLLRYPLQDFYLQLERILSDIDDVGLEITTFSPQEEKHKAFYEKSLITFNISGDFERMMSFLSFFDNRNMLAIFKKACIKRGEDNLSLDSTIALYKMERDG